MFTGLVLVVNGEGYSAVIGVMDPNPDNKNSDPPTNPPPPKKKEGEMCT